MGRQQTRIPGEEPDSKQTETSAVVETVTPDATQRQTPEVPADASSGIDPTKLTRAVLTKDGWLCPQLPVKVAGNV